MLASELHLTASTKCQNFFVEKSHIMSKNDVSLSPSLLALHHSNALQKSAITQSKYEKLEFLNCREHLYNITYAILKNNITPELSNYFKYLLFLKTTSHMLFLKTMSSIFVSEIIRCYEFSNKIF